MTLNSIHSMKSYKYITPTSLRGVCIANNYYTKGTIADYENLLNMVSVVEYHTKGDQVQIRTLELTDELLSRIIIDIYNHSDVETIKHDYLCTDDTVLESIAGEILRAAVQGYRIVGNYSEEVQ